MSKVKTAKYQHLTLGHVMASAAIYLPTDKIDLSKFLNVIESDKALWKPATFFKVAIGSDVVKFNVMPKAEISEHLDGLRGYINTLEEPEDKKLFARSVANATQSVLGLVTDRDFRDNEEVYATLFEVAGFYKQGLFLSSAVSFYLETSLSVPRAST